MILDKAVIVKYNILYRNINIIVMFLSIISRLESNDLSFNKYFRSLNKSAAVIGKPNEEESSVKVTNRNFLHGDTTFGRQFTINESTTFYKPPLYVNNTIVNSNSSALLMDKLNLSDFNSLEKELHPDFTLEDDGVRSVGFEERRREDSYTLTKPEENPYSVLMISYLEKEPQGICSGSLLTPEWVLSAAHCLEGDIDSVKVYAGGYTFDELQDNKPAKGGQIEVSSKYFLHPNYKDSGHDNDVSLTRLDRPFSLTKTVDVVKLSTKPWSYYSYQKCKITGFGRVRLSAKTPEDYLRKTSDILVKNPCLCSFKLQLLLGTKTVKRYLCSKPKEDYGICPGDSGGGLWCDGEIRGVAVQIIQMSNVKVCEMHIVGIECGTKNTLSIFQDTCPFLRWINGHVKLYNESQMSEKCQDLEGGSDRIRSTAVNILLCLPFCYFLRVWQHW